ncbi:hypothetical protein ACIRVK_37600 [Streptomyces sp. NPDC101152]|uniref:hypothetical protein n=1 Tax=Streptomyces sp. NPDC101152 TaxID=3366116 RepID=UPI0038124ACF
MAGPTGHGNSLGAALNDLLRSQVTPRHRLSSYNAQHWHAQLSQLTGTRRGYQALEDAGLGVTAQTLINWLSDPEGRMAPCSTGSCDRRQHAIRVLLQCQHGRTGTDNG